MTDVLIVTEEQAVALEKAGIKVDVQYIVRLSDMVKMNREQVAKPLPASPRTVKYGRDATLRWTGLKWTGSKDTQPHHAYMLLAEYFSSRANKALKRSDINAWLAPKFLAVGMPFNSSVVTHLCNQKYLEPVSS